MPAVRVPKLPGVLYPFPLRDVPGEVMAEIEAAAGAARMSANGYVLAMLDKWAARMRKARHAPVIPVIQPVVMAVRQLTAPEFGGEGKGQS